MATLTTSNVAAGVQPKVQHAGATIKTATYTLAASSSAGDVIQMIKVAKNETPLYVAVLCTGAGVGTARVGDGVSTGRYIEPLAYSATMAQTLINVVAFAPYTYSTDDTIDITISAVSLASTVGSFTIIVMSTMDP